MIFLFSINKKLSAGLSGLSNVENLRLLRGYFRSRYLSTSGEHIKQPLLLYGWRCSKTRKTHGYIHAREKYTSLRRSLGQQIFYNLANRTLPKIPQAKYVTIGSARPRLLQQQGSVYGENNHTIRIAGNASLNKLPAICKG